jgi:hypothetical protein
VAEDGGESGQGLHVAQICIGSKHHADEAANVHGGGALEHIAEEGGRAQALAAGAQHVGGADVAAAHGADVLMAEEAHQHIAHGNGAEQVGNRNHEQACKQHVETEFTTAR